MKVTTKQIAGGWMVYVDGREYIAMPLTMHTALKIAENAQRDIKNSVKLSFPA